MVKLKTINILGWPNVILNLKEDEISILTFFKFYCKKNRNLSEIILKPTFGTP